MFWLKQKNRKVSNNMPSQSANYFVPSPWSGRRDGKKPLQWAAKENARATRFELSISLGIWFCVCVWRMYLFYSFEDVSFYICFQYLERKWKRCTKAFCNFTMSSDVLSLYSSRTGSISMGVIYVYIYIITSVPSSTTTTTKARWSCLVSGDCLPSWLWELWCWLLGRWSLARHQRRGYDSMLEQLFASIGCLLQLEILTILQEAAHETHIEEEQYN